MVRRVRPGRRDAARRPLRWTGPPPLLVIATLAAMVVLPFLDGGTAGASPASTTSPRSLEPYVVHPQLTEVSRGGEVTREVAPVRLKQVPLGIASVNMFKMLTPELAHADAVKVTAQSGIDVIGWQEANRFTGVLHDLPGWRTRTFMDGAQPSELAVSWRDSEFSFVSARQRSVATGVGWQEGLYPFPTRKVATVTLRHRATGRLLTVVDTHLPQAIEDLSRPGRWTPTINAGRARAQLQRIAALWKGLDDHWLVGIGDFNFDARADATQHPPGGPRAALGPVAVSNYMALGTDVEPTFPENGRYIDYVWLDRRAHAAGTARFVRQWVLGGLNSDHNALVVRVVLS